MEFNVIQNDFISEYRVVRGSISRVDSDKPIVPKCVRIEDTDVATLQLPT